MRTHTRSENTTTTTTTTTRTVAWPRARHSAVASRPNSIVGAPVATTTAASAPLTAPARRLPPASLSLRVAHSRQTSMVSIPTPFPCCFEQIVSPLSTLFVNFFFFCFQSFFFFFFGLGFVTHFSQFIWFQQIIFTQYNYYFFIPISNQLLLFFFLKKKNYVNFFPFLLFHKNNKTNKNHLQTKIVFHFH